MASHEGSRDPSGGEGPVSARRGARTLGVTVPLFSLRSGRDFGIGEIGDLPRFAEWVRGTGARVIQLLPSFELSRGETSPYGARTAFGLDPLAISLADVPELDRATMAEVLAGGGEAELSAVRRAVAVDYERVRALKERALAAAFANFESRELARATRRADEFRAFQRASAAWSDDLSLYVALRDEHHEHGWSTWEAALRDRNPAALRVARERLARPILAHQYRQFVANEQWHAARRALASLGVELMGDLPFIVGGESADVWSHRRAFRSDVSLGAPPDAYSEEGQDWGLPAYDLERMEQDGFEWLRTRTARARQLYDRFRIDHVVGYFRQWVKPKAPLVHPDGKSTPQRGHFDVVSERLQHARGERVLRAMSESAGRGAIIAEDLGVIPRWVRSTLTELGIPGYKIIPWEREGFVYRDPRAFPWLSIASYSTHDTAPIGMWWNEMAPEERAGLAQIFGVAATTKGDELWAAQMRTLFGSGAGLALVLLQEILGEDVRINTPGVVGPENWSYRMATSVERLADDARVAARAARVRALLAETHRLMPGEG